MYKFAMAAAAAACLFASSAHAAPGLDAEVYGATLDKGEIEFETRYNQLAGGPDGGEGVIKLEGAYTVTHNLRLAVTGEFEREAGGPRKPKRPAWKPSIRSAGSAASISPPTANTSWD